MSKPKNPALENPFKGTPHGWVQWKGTDVCMDIHCECGHLGHIDADFAYHVRCAKCGDVYAINGHVKFHKIEIEPGAELPPCTVLAEL